VVWCRVALLLQKDMWLKDIELCGHNMITILILIIHIIVEEGALYDHLMSTRMFTLIIPKFIRKVASLGLDFVSHLAPFACFMSWVKWVSWEKLTI
jgi:hypothetical protein